jgi:hypothetical protein
VSSDPKSKAGKPASGPGYISADHAQQARMQAKHEKLSDYDKKKRAGQPAEGNVDEMSEDSFPASDPPSTSPPSRVGRPPPSTDEKPPSRGRRGRD